MTIYPSWVAQIINNKLVQIVILEQDKVSTKIPLKYANYIDVFLLDLVIELSEKMNINEYAIELEEGKQPSYRPIYNLGLVELKTLKIYIKTHLKTRFIPLSKSPSGVTILLYKKLDNSFRLCVDYWGFNNLTIKNKYYLTQNKK